MMMMMKTNTCNKLYQLQDPDQIRFSVLLATKT